MDGWSQLLYSIWFLFGGDISLACMLLTVSFIVSYLGSALSIGMTLLTRSILII